MKYILYCLGVLISLGANANQSKKVLVVLSSENKITLKNEILHPTGFFLSELMVPVEGLLRAGYEPIFVTPNGNSPAMDKISDSAFWFNGDEKRYQEIKNLYSQMAGLKQPLRLRDVRRQSLSQYAGIFVPGGHAPMEDLLHDKDLGQILRYFHENGKPTALICHGPIALLSTLQNPNEFTQGLIIGTPVATQDWIYRGYAMTVFSTPEEKQEEPGEDNVLGGFVKFYPDYALQTAGGQVSVANKWQSHVVRDRELITAQNPMSDVEFTKVLIQALNEGK